MFEVRDSFQKLMIVLPKDIMYIYAYIGICVLIHTYVCAYMWHIYIYQERIEIIFLFVCMKNKFTTKTSTFQKY